MSRRVFRHHHQLLMIIIVVVMIIIIIISHSQMHAFLQSAFNQMEQFPGQLAQFRTVLSGPVQIPEIVAQQANLTQLLTELARARAVIDIVSALQPTRMDCGQQGSDAEDAISRCHRSIEAAEHNIFVVSTTFKQSRAEALVRFDKILRSTSRRLESSAQKLSAKEAECALSKASLQRAQAALQRCRCFTSNEQPQNDARDITRVQRTPPSIQIEELMRLDVQPQVQLELNEAVYSSDSSFISFANSSFEY